MADDTFIISRLYKGDEDAFRYIFDNEYGLMCSFANRMLHDRAMAESIADDVIFNLWESHERLNITSSLRSYLLGAVRNRCINELKSRIKRLSATNASQCFSQHKRRNGNARRYFHRRQPTPRNTARTGTRRTNKSVHIAAF